MINLGVAEWVDGTLRMNNAGVLFFTESIQLLCEQATITCGVFDGTERVQVLNRKDYTMDMVNNINNTLHFIKQELRVKYEMTGTARRREVYEIPLDAIREAVINAVMHRDYFLFGAHVTVDIFDDRIEIGNPGGLPKGLKEEEFGKKSVRRNPLIATLLHRINLVENMGTGIGKIKGLLKEAGAPEARFTFGDFYTIIFPRPGKFLGESSENEPLNEPLSEPLNRIIQEIKRNPGITKNDLAILLDCSRATITRQIQKLREKERIRRVGSDKTGHWEVVDYE